MDGGEIVNEFKCKVFIDFIDTRDSVTGHVAIVESGAFADVIGDVFVFAGDDNSEDVIVATRKLRYQVFAVVYTDGLTI